MASRRTRVLLAVVVGLAVAQVFVEDLIVFLGATDTPGPAILGSPLALVFIPFALFLLLVGTVFAWALTADGPEG